MIGALIAVTVVGLLEYFYWRRWYKEVHTENEILRAIARKIGVDESEYIG